MESPKPATLMEAIRHYADPDAALSEVADSRWPTGVTCQHCGAENPMFLKTRRVWKCSKCRKQFSIKSKSVFEDSPIPLDKWLAVVWMLANCKNGISSYEVARDLGVTQKTAWFMLHRVRLAMMDDDGNKLSGEIEADETFVGGRIAHMHRKSKRYERAKSAGTNWNKTIVLGLLQREGNVRAAVAPSRTKHHVEPFLQNNVELGSKLYTDELPVYGHAAPEIERQFVNHLESYVEGRVHTNGIENFWSLLKRGLKGTYVSVDPAHLQAYVDEQAFRFNNRKETTDFDRFKLVLSQIVGRRTTYDQLIGKKEDGPDMSSN